MLIVAIVSGGFAVPAMAASAQNPSGRPNADPNWLRTDSVNSVEYPGGEIISRPASVRARLSRAQALTTVDSAGFPAELRPGAPEVALRFVTNKPRGKSQPEYVDRLAWLIAYRGSQPQLRGPATLADAQRKQLLASLYCLTLFVVDANTAELIEVQQFCK